MKILLYMSCAFAVVSVVSSLTTIQVPSFGTGESESALAYDGRTLEHESKSLFRPKYLHGEGDTKNFYIREGKFSDMGRVANIIVDSFYSPSIFVRPFLYASELQRLQDNFPYNDKHLHTYFVACTKKDVDKEIVIGFVDIDARPSKNADAPPRPYLSDLAIDKHHRRLGLAKKLVRQCEARVKEMGMTRLFLRVERENGNARTMYQNLGYDQLNHHIFGIKDTTILLKRYFDQAQPC